MRFIFVLYFFSFLFSSIAIARPIDDYFTNSPISLTNECRSFINELKINDFEYGWVKSYENPKDPSSSPVFVFYYMQKGFENLMPTIYFNGGPQSDSHYSIRSFSTLRDNQLTTHFRMVFTDQRGTGCSSAYPDYNPESSFRYIYWSAIGIVHDAEKIRTHLGIPKWNIFGQSYGGIIVQRYIEQYPESILKAVAHGGLGLGNSENSAFFIELRQEFQIYVVQKFLQYNPSAADHVKAIVNRRLCAPADLETVTCGASLIRTLGSQRGLFGDVRYWAYFSDLLRKIVRYNVSQPLGSSGNIFNEVWGGSFSKFKARQYISHIDIPSSYNNYNHLRTLGIRTLGSSELLALTEFYDYGNRDLRKYRPAVDEQMHSIKVQTQVEEINLETIRQNLEKNPNIKFYVFSAQWDYFSPPVILERAVRLMGPRVNYAEVLGEGHFSYNNPCIFIRSDLIPVSGYTETDRLRVYNYCDTLLGDLPFSQPRLPFESSNQP